MSIFRVGLTRDFLTPVGQIAMGEIGLGALKHKDCICIEFFHEHLTEVTPEQIAGYDAIISLAPRITARTLSGAASTLTVLARFGVGYDMVDVQALTDQNVILTITPDGVR